MSTTVTAGPTFGTLARKEIVRYLRHPLFLAGAVLLVISGLLQPEDWFRPLSRGSRRLPLSGSSAWWSWCR
jgi:hypothetical protein